ncbi:MAG: hypothetical protein IKH33_06260 [Bacteroidales bacterium]|nr:hypothetical protein [Bacteroidales bacterium]
MLDKHFFQEIGAEFSWNIDDIQSFVFECKIGLDIDASGREIIFKIGWDMVENIAIPPFAGGRGNFFTSKDRNYCYKNAYNAYNTTYYCDKQSMGVTPLTNIMQN